MYEPIAQNYVFYARRSSTDPEDRQITSTANQIETMMFLKDRGFNIVKVIEESASAFKPGRPRFNEEVIEPIYEGVYDGIVVMDINRIARNPTDGGVVLQLVSDGRLKHIQSHSISYTEKSNLLPLYLEFGMAHQDSRGKGQFTKVGMYEKAKRGWYPSGQILGYYHIPPNKEKNIEESIEISENNFQILSHLWQMAISRGYTLAQIHREAQKLELISPAKRIVSYNGLRNMFMNEFYCGFYRWKNLDGTYERFQGKHKAIVTEAQFREVQRNLFSRKRSSGNDCSLKFKYRGVFSCKTCSRMFSAERKSQTRCSNCQTNFSSLNKSSCPKCGLDIREMPRSRTRNKVYYRCGGAKLGCTEPGVETQSLTNSIASFLKEHELDPDFVDLLKKLLEGKTEGEFAVEESLKTKKRKVSDLRSRKNALISMRAAGEISARDLKLTMNEIEERIIRLEEDIDIAQDIEHQWKIRVCSILQVLKKTKDSFTILADSDKFNLLKKMSSNHYIHDRKPYFTMHRVFRMLKTCSNGAGRKSGEFEPQNSLQTKALKTENAAFSATFSAWLPKLKKIRIHTIASMEEENQLISKGITTPEELSLLN